MKTTESDDVIRSVVDRIVATRRPKRVILFGSRGRGETRKDSDIDLCVLYEKMGERNLEVTQALYLDIFDVMDLPVDLIVYDEAVFQKRAARPNSFESVIDAEGLTVYG